MPVGDGRKLVSRQIIFVLLVAAVFFAFKIGLLVLPKMGLPDVVMYAGILVFALFAHGVRLADLPALMRRVLVAMFVMFAAYLSFSKTMLPAESLTGAENMHVLYGHYVWPLLCLAGLFRPGYGVIAMVGAAWERLTLSQYFGSSLSQTEFFPLVELSMFMVIGAALSLHLGKTRWRDWIAESTRPDAPRLLEFVALAAIAVHMANYLYSGVTKVGLGTYGVDWVLENKTQYLLMVYHGMGMSPLSIIDGLPEFSYVAFDRFFVVSNLLIFAGQLAAITAMVRIRWLMVLTAFYDLTHIVIYLCTGIFFYKWIVLNFAIIAGLATIRYKRIHVAQGAFLTAFIVSAPLVFWVARLGWWDTRALNQERIYAVFKDGAELEVPTNYWGSFAVHFAQMRLLRDRSENFFPTWTSGLTNVKEDMLAANRCEYSFSATEQQKEVDAFFASGKGVQLASHIRRHHAYVLTQTGEDGTYNYDMYPHHIWSAPWLFKAFAAADKRDIVEYRLVIEPTCYAFIDNRFVPQVKGQASYAISVR